MNIRIKSVLFFMVLLFSWMAGAASIEAATNNSALGCPSVSIGSGQNLGTIRIEEITYGSFTPGMQIVISLPDDSNYAATPSQAAINNYVFLPVTVSGTSNALSIGDIEVNPISSNKALVLDVVHITNSSSHSGIDVLFNVPGFSQVDVNGGGGAFKVKIQEVNGAVNNGYVINAYCIGGVTESSALNTPTCTPGTGIALGTVQIKENQPGDLFAFDKSVSLTLPWGVTWTEAEIKISGGFLEGDVSLAGFDTDSDGHSRLWLNIKQISVDWPGPYTPPHITNNEVGIIQIKGLVNIAPGTPKGDLYVKIGGTNPGIKKCNVLVAKLVAASVVSPETPVKTVAKFKIGTRLYSLNGVEAYMDAAPYIKNGRTYIPLYYAARALGITDDDIRWDSGQQTITLIKKSKTVQLKIGSSDMKIGGISSHLEAAPEIRSDRTCLPIALIVQAFGGESSWDESNRIVIISSK